MKAIFLHGPAQDASGAFRDAGETLTIAKTGKPETIGDDEAKELVKLGRAIDAAKAPSEPAAEGNLD